MGTVFCCPLVFSQCEFQINDFDYFHQSSGQLKVHIQVKKACSNHSFNKRELEKININIFQGEKLHSSYSFDHGLWQEKVSRFLLKREKAFLEGCFKGLNQVYLNLKDGFINSQKGTYWNLETGDSLNLNCV